MLLNYIKWIKHIGDYREIVARVSYSLQINSLRMLNHCSGIHFNKL